MNTIEPPKAHYSVTLDAQIEGLTLPLQVHAESVNELRKAVRLLRANDMLASSRRAPATTSASARVGVAPRRLCGVNGVANATPTTLWTTHQPTYRSSGRVLTGTLGARKERHHGP